MIGGGKPGVPYSEVREDMRTFDVLLFKGTQFVSNAISEFERFADRTGDFTHVGMFVRGCDLIGVTSFVPDPSGAYVFESTASGKLCPDDVPDVHGHRHFGVQLRNLDEVVAKYDEPEDSRLAWCPLSERFDNLQRHLVSYEYNKYKGLSYPYSMVNVASSVLSPLRRVRDGWFSRCLWSLLCCCCNKDRDDRSPGSPARYDNTPTQWQFCSKLVANIYKDVGVLPEWVKPEDVAPVDFIPSNAVKIPRVSDKIVAFHK